MKKLITWKFTKFSSRTGDSLMAQWVKTCLQCRRHRKHGFDPCVGKIPWRRAWQHTLNFLREKSYGQRSLTGYSPWGGKRVRHDIATKQNWPLPTLLWFSRSVVWLFTIPWTAACQVSLSITSSRSLLKLMSIELVMPSNHLFLCRPLLLLPSAFPSITVFQMSQFFTTDGQNIGISASTSVLPMNIQDYFL